MVMNPNELGCNCSLLFFLQNKQGVWIKRGVKFDMRKFRVTTCFLLFFMWSWIMTTKPEMWPCTTQTWMALDEPCCRQVMWLPHTVIPQRFLPVWMEDTMSKNSFFTLALPQIVMVRTRDHSKGESWSCIIA